MSQSTVAALYVDLSCGPYPKIDGVDCWGYATKSGRQSVMFLVQRDARTYLGPHPVIAHPPCGPWGRFSWNYKGGEGDATCGPAAVCAVRECGGILEHPSGSKLWDACELPRPGDPADRYGGTTISVDQCDWGHPARKPTWLYSVDVTFPPRPPPGQPTHVMVRLLTNGNELPELPKHRRHITTEPFAHWLIRAARTASEEQ